MGKTSIQWTDRVWNPTTGCTKVSAGCKNCYAEGIADRFWATQYRPVLADSGKSIDTISTSHHEDYLANGFARPRRFTDVQTHEDRLLEPLSWRKPARVFVNSMSDLFHEDVPDEFIDCVFAVMARASRHTFQILTKRPRRMRDYMDAANRRYEIELEMYAIGGDNDARTIPDLNWPLRNVWLGVSVENQKYADERIPLLLQTPATVRFISAEPLLGPIDLMSLPMVCDDGKRGTFSGLHGVIAGYCGGEKPRPATPHLDWVIVGGESGPKARPFDLAWARSLVQQCKAARVPVFVKQLGSFPYDSSKVSCSLETCVPHDMAMLRLKDRKGGTPSEWPDPFPREFPAVAR